MRERERKLKNSFVSLHLRNILCEAYFPYFIIHTKSDLRRFAQRGILSFEASVWHAALREMLACHLARVCLVALALALALSEM
jgi:hypothetical protein